MYENYKLTPKFKEGDYVICEDVNQSRLTLYGLYKIESVHEYPFNGLIFYNLEDFGRGSHEEYRFRLATEEEIAAHKYNI